MSLQVKTLADWEADGLHNCLSIVIPAHNEAQHIEQTVLDLHDALTVGGISHEILVVNDNSRDETEQVLLRLEASIPEVRYINNQPPNGFGFAVRCGLAEFRGDVVAIVMADGSDDPHDVVAFYHKLQEGFDCVFGSRFRRGGSVTDYPWPKLILNRLANSFIQTIFWLPYNDITNAFKMYRRNVVAGVQPLLSRHFNLTVELPLKAIVRGYRFCVVPNSWKNRKQGVSKFNIREMGSRYLFIVTYCWLEKQLARGDYQNSPELKKTQLQVWSR
jgi:dolichol-phosphate mannosyltransferase